jgi:hypothetical protein
MTMPNEVTGTAINYQHLHWTSIYVREKDIFFSISVNFGVKPGSLLYPFTIDSFSYHMSLERRANPQIG